MPWNSLAELRASPTFAKSETLRKFPEFRLRRFLAVFSAIWDKKKTAGSSDEEAEAAAFSLAFSSAARFVATPSGSTLESAKHYAATLAPVQFSLGGAVQDNDFALLLTSLDTVSLAVAGSAFNLDHDSTDALGVITRLILPKDAPPEVQAKLAKDTPFVTEFSYFEDTPEELKSIKTVSAEWLPSKRTDGRSDVLFPFSFAVTKEPATDHSLGVGIIAAASSDAGTKPYVSPIGLVDTRPSSMPETPTTPLLEEKLAAMAGLLDGEKKARHDAELKFAALDAEVKNHRKLVDELKAAALDKESEDAALALVSEGKAPSDKVTYFAALYCKMGKENFAELAAALPVSALGEAKQRSAAKPVATDEQHASLVKGAKELMVRGA